MCVFCVTMSEQKNDVMSLEQLGKDAVADMSDVSPQYKLKPPMPDADGKYRDISGVIFNEKRNATDENGRFENGCFF